MSHNDVLLKLRRKYSKDEVVAALSKEISEKDVLIGKLSAEIEHLNFEIAKMSALSDKEKTSFKKDIKKEEMYTAILNQNKKLREVNKNLTNSNNVLMSENLKLKTKKVEINEYVEMYKRLFKESYQ